MTTPPPKGRGRLRGIDWIAAVTGMGRAMRLRVNLRYAYWIALAVLAGLGLATWFTLPDPRLRTVLQAVGETITVTIANPDIAAFRVGRMRAIADAEDVGECVAGVVAPVTDSVVTYARLGSGSPIIRIAPDPRTADDLVVVAHLTRRDGSTATLRGSHRLIGQDDCAGGELPRRLPIHGAAEFGREHTPPSVGRDAMAGYLSEGTLTVYGQAVDRVLKVFSLSSTIYEVMKIQVPAGARIEAITGERDGEAPIWWGVARVEDGKSGFAIEASTAAREIALRIPGVTDDAGVIRLGKFAQVTKDPNALAVQIYFVFLISAVPLCFKAWRKLATWERKRRLNLNAQQLTHYAPMLIAVGAALFLSMSVPVVAEPVRLLLGGDLTGQGWMFQDRLGSCRIATAAHNLERDGRPISPVAIDRRGEEIPTAEPVRPDPNVDVGLLLARPARSCSTQGLSEADVDARLVRSPQAFLDLVRDRAVSTLALLRRQRGMDSGGGRILLFERASDAVDLTQGLSGGAVLDGTGRPLGITTSVNVEDGRLSAVRIDVVAALFDVKVLSRGGRADLTVTGWSIQNGRSADPTRGPDAMLARSPPGWRVVTDRGFIMLTARLLTPRPLSAVSMAFGAEASGAIEDLQVLVPNGPVDDAATRWITVRRCSMPDGGTELRCAFAKIGAVAAVRLILRTKIQQTSLYALALE